MSEAQAPGQTAYEVYSAAMDGKNEAGLPMARWEDVFVGHKVAWAQVETACQRMEPAPEVEPPGEKDAAAPSTAAPTSGRTAEAGPASADDDDTSRTGARRRS